MKSQYRYHFTPLASADGSLMKTIGIIGGMSWESTAEYYRIINEAINRDLGRLHSGKILLYSVDFEEIEQLQHENKWQELSDLMIDAGQKLEKAGADLLLIATNTMHKLADKVQDEVSIPLLHIADATATKVLTDRHFCVGLLGTKYTMEQDFYKHKLQERGLTVLIPDEQERAFVHTIIYDELCKGKVLDASRKKYKKIIQNLANKGAQGIILGCTEIPLLIKQKDSPITVYDTTRIHAETAVEFALK